VMRKESARTDNYTERYLLFHVSSEQPAKTGEYVHSASGLYSKPVATAKMPEPASGSGERKRGW
jgi:hypothetical protein